MQTIEEAIAGFRVKHQEAVQFAPANSNVIEMKCSIHGVYSSIILYKMVRSKCPQCEEEYLAIKKAQEAIE